MGLPFFFTTTLPWLSDGRHLTHFAILLALEREGWGHLQYEYVVLGGLPWRGFGFPFGFPLKPPHKGDTPQKQGQRLEPKEGER